MEFDFSFLQIEWIYYLVIIVISSVISFFAIPSIIFVARERQLFDDVESSRKDHDQGTPRLGGVAIFCSFTIVSLLFAKYDAVLPTNILLTSALFCLQ